MTKLRFLLAAAVSFSTIAGCAARSDSTASFEYDLRGHRTLHAYMPEPAPETRGAEKLHHGLYGALGNTKSPKTPYMCTWRDTGANRMAQAAGAPPSEIFLACFFGTSPWTPPVDMIEAATQLAKREGAVLRVTWERRGTSYRITRFEVEIHDVSSGTHFRSANFGDAELAALRIESDMKFPGTAKDPLGFRISAMVPRRFNRGEKTTAPTASLTISGTAVPMPDWVVY